MGNNQTPPPPSTSATPVQPGKKPANTLHPTHKTRISMGASLYDEICVKCGHTDIATGGWGKLAEPCPEENGPEKY